MASYFTESGKEIRITRVCNGFIIHAPNGDLYIAKTMKEVINIIVKF